MYTVSSVVWGNWLPDSRLLQWVLGLMYVQRVREISDSELLQWKLTNINILEGHLIDQGCPVKGCS